MSRRQPTLGVVVLDARVSLDTLAEQGATDTTCTYTEAGPGPGHPELADGSLWRPRVSQAQSVALTLRAARGGYASLRTPGGGYQTSTVDGSRILYREASQTAQSDYRGWDEPVTVTGWTAPPEAWGGSQVWSGAAAAVIAETGVIVVVAVDASRNAQTWSWDPRTGDWTLLYDWDTGSLDGLDPDRTLGMAYDVERRRLILWSDYVYYSDDAGVSWSTYSLDLPAGSGDAVLRVAPHGSGGDWLAIGTDLGASPVETQYASSDAGVTWDVVGTTSLIASQSPWPLRTRGGYLYLYVDSSTADLLCRRLASARSALDDAADIVIDDSRDYEVVWGVVDDDGTVYVYARGQTADGISDEVWCWYSLDDGATWQVYSWQCWATADTTRYLEPIACVASGGRIHLVGTPIGSTTTDGTIQVVSFGGWSSVASGPRAYQPQIRASRMGYGRRGTTRSGDLYIPIAFPDNLGWTASTSTGTRSLSGTTPGLELTTTAGQGEVYRAEFTGVDALHCAGEAGLLVYSDSSTLATIGTGNTGVSVLAVLRDGATYSYAGQIDIGRDGIQVRDGSTIRATVLFTVSDDVLRLRWHMTKGLLWVYYAVGLVGTEWTRLANGVTITDAGGVAIPFADDALIWGQGTTATGHATWLWVGGSSDGAWQSGIDSLSERQEDADSRVIGHQFGGPLPSRGSGRGYPIPDGTAAGESLALVSAAGRCAAGESASLPVQYTYPIGALHPSESPDPRRGWRATSRAAIQLVWDQGADQSSWWGGAIALVAVGVAPRRWVLERSDDGTTWTELGELDLEIGTDLTYTLIGRTLAPSTTTDPVDRYLAEGELVGGHVALGTGGLTETDVRRITRQSAGYWAPASSGVQQVRLELEGIDGTEATSGSTMALATASGVLICYPTADSPTRYLRVTTGVPAPPTTVYGSPDVYYAGILGIGRVLGLGLTPAWGWTQTTQLERQVARALDGVPSVRRSGPSRRRLSYSWPDGIPLEPLRLLTSSPDWIAIASGAPIGTWLDPAYSVAGVAELLESGQVPGVLIRRLPTSTSTITDPSQWVYGLLDVGSVTLTGIAGTEGTSEVVSVSSLQLEELPWR